MAARRRNRTSVIDEVTRVRRDRHGPAEETYIAGARPISKSDLIIDNNDYLRPKIVPSVSD
ncbi:MAG TPA: hypothetical protein VIJ40_08585 [Acidimicrobiales bacterium]